MIVWKEVGKPAVTIREEAGKEEMEQQAAVIAEQEAEKAEVEEMEQRALIIAEGGIREVTTREAGETIGRWPPTDRKQRAAAGG